MIRPAICVALITLFCLTALPISAGRSWVHRGFSDFSQGSFDDGGSNLYVNADGVIELIHRWDIDNDSYVDLVLADNHDNLERGPTNVFKVDTKRERGWVSKTLANDSGYMNRITDVDGDGVADLVVVNSYNGINAQLPSYVYWGGPGGPTEKRVDLPTMGAYDVAVVDINRDGRLDLVFPSAWNDPHNVAEPIPCKVYLQQPNHKFVDATGSYSLFGVGATSIGTDDLNKDGFTDIVLANSRIGRDPNTDSFIYWGKASGFGPNPQKLPTQSAGQVEIADVNLDGFKDVLIACGDGIHLYWNKSGVLDKDNFVLVAGSRSVVADVNGDRFPDLITTGPTGVYIRSGTELDKVTAMIPISGSSWVTASDMNGDGCQDLVVSRFVSDGTYDTESVVFWNDSEGFSPSRAAYLPTHGAMGNAVGDLDGDGKPEIAINSTASGHIQDDVPSFIYLGGKSGYDVKNRLALQTAGTSTCDIVDFDRDGYNDIVFCTMSVYAGGTPHGGVRVFWGSKDGIRPSKYLDLETSTNVVFTCKVADFNKDGYLDILSAGVAAEPRPEQIAVASTIFWGSKGGFLNSNNQRIASNGYNAAVADLNKDGWLDLVFDDRRDFIRIYWGGAKGYSDGCSENIACENLSEGAKINIADINNDGWLDLILGMLSSRIRQPDTVHIYYGSRNGYSKDRRQSYLGNYGTGYTGIADYNRDGNLDLMTSAYLSGTSRVLPAQLFWGNGREIDFSKRQDLYSEGSTAVVQIDLNRDGWIDAFVVCHRNDIGHQVDSRLYWNSPKGFSEDNFTALPGLGPHGTVARDFGNVYTREPWEDYVSSPYGTNGAKPTRISWIGDVPQDASLKFQVRFAPTIKDLDKSEWAGPKGKDSFYERSGESVTFVPTNANFIQYRARFTYLYGCLSPKLQQVRIDLE